MSHRRPAWLAFAFALVGCFDGAPLGARSPCENTFPMSPPSDLARFERFAPKAAASPDRDPRHVTVRPGYFDDVAFARSVYPGLIHRDAPVLEKGLVICAFEARETAGIDGTDLTPIATPDLVVWAQFGEQKVSRGPASFSTTALFPFKVRLADGDPVVFTFGDFDVFSSNDYIGRIEGRYAGKLPFSVRGKAGAATCNALTERAIAGWHERAVRELGEEVSRFEAFVPTFEAAYDEAARSRIEALLGRIEYFDSPTDAPAAPLDGAPEIVKETARRVEEASKKQWARHIRALEAFVQELPPPGRFAPIDDRLDGRVVGLICQTGDKLVPWCGPELEIRVNKPIEGEELCPVGITSLGKIEPLMYVRSNGDTDLASVHRVFVGDRPVVDQTALAKLSPGQLLRVQLSTGGRMWRKTPDDWDLPLLKVGKAYMRIL